MSRIPEFDELASSRGTRLLRTAYAPTGDWALAEDLVQTETLHVDAADDDGYVRSVVVEWDDGRRRGTTRATSPDAPSRPPRGHRAASPRRSSTRTSPTAARG